MKIYKEITVDLDRVRPMDIMHIHVDDKNSIELKIMVTKDDAEVTLNGLTIKYDAAIAGHLAEEDASGSISSNRIIIPVTDNMVALPGLLEIDVKMIEGTQTLYTQTINLQVARSVIDESAVIDISGTTIAEKFAELENDKQDIVTGSNTIALLGDSGLVDSNKNFDDLIEWTDADTSEDGELSNDDVSFPTSKLMAALLADKADTSDVETALADKLETAPDGDNFLLNAQMKVSSLYLDDAVKNSYIYGGVITAFDSDTKVADITPTDAARARIGTSYEYIHYQLTDAALVGLFFKTNVNFVLSYNQYNTSDLIVCFGGSVAALTMKPAGMAATYVPYVGNTTAPPTGYVLAQYQLGTMYMYNNSGVYTPYICVESNYNGGLGYKHKWLNLKTGEVISE